MLSFVPVLHWPFKWLQTYYHEISHGLAALATDGEILRIVLHIDGSGVCYTQGGIRSLTLQAGYQGSVFWGGYCQVVTVKVNESKDDVLFTS